MKDRCRYLDIADSSAVESAAALDILVAQKRLTAEDVRDGKVLLKQIVSLIMGLRSHAQSRIGEELAPYGKPEQE